jgi:hypothetical protein
MPPIPLRLLQLIHRVQQLDWYLVAHHLTPPPLPGPWSNVTYLQVAIEGCCHGELDNIYATLEYMQKAKGQKVDLLICCGDFQVRLRKVMPDAQHVCLSAQLQGCLQLRCAPTA